MLVVSSREFRENQKKYFDLVDADEDVIIQRDKTKAYILAPISDKDKLSRNEELIQQIAKAEIEYKEGNVITGNPQDDIWDLFPDE